MNSNKKQTNNMNTTDLINFTKLVLGIATGIVGLLLSIVFFIASIALQFETGFSEFFSLLFGTFLAIEIFEQSIKAMSIAFEADGEMGDSYFWERLGQNIMNVQEKMIEGIFAFCDKREKLSDEDQKMMEYVLECDKQSSIPLYS